ncbi:MAG: MoxR family ATPase [Proteobacteria bacterium]|nr:MoxR family ATPase [Pseudomonadota bacterium]
MSSNFNGDVLEFQRKFADVKSEIAKVVVGQDALVHRLLIGLITGGHILVEGVPGLAKTLLIRTLAECLNATFSRIQFTPDMLPVDVTGTEIFNPKDATFSIKKGPIFGNLILADEINRAPAKVQSALLEAMQEKQVTIGNESFQMASPFLVMATQNPIEQEGTYPLPEAQLDRFMLKVVVGYLTREEEIRVVERMAGATPVPTVRQIMDMETVLQAKAAAENIHMDNKVSSYAVDLVNATRYPKDYGLSDIAPFIEMGASPRASINLVKAGKAHALLNGRDYLSPHEIKTIAPDVLRHRIALTYEAEAQGKTADDIITRILEILVP